MKKYSILFILFLAVITGCNALGIQEADNASSENVVETANGVVNENQVSAGTQVDLQAEQIAQMQTEIDELVSALNTKDMIVAELENKTSELNKQIEELTVKMANTQAAYDNLQGLVSTNNLYRNIAIIVALVSILLNILLIVMLFKAKAKYSRAALPPAKKDEDILNKESKKDKKEEKQEESKKDNNVIENENKAQENTAPEAKESKRGRPKKAEKIAENKEETENNTAKKRGRPKKEQAVEANEDKNDNLI